MSANIRALTNTAAIRHGGGPASYLHMYDEKNTFNFSDFCDEHI